MNSKISIKDKLSDTELYTFDIAQSEDAYRKAMELEDLGLDIELVIPNSIEALANKLGLNPKEVKNISQEISDEIESH